jgi:hypothetical protein
VLPPTKPSLQPLFSQNEIRLKVYYPGGLNCKHIDDRFDNDIVLHCIQYSAANKLKIVSTIDKNDGRGAPQTEHGLQGPSDT